MPSWVTIVITSSVIASFINVGGSWLRDHRREQRTRREDASLSALYVALQLERYARDCADLVGDLDAYLGSRGNAGKSYSRLPAKPDLAVEVNWKALGVAVTAKYLHFWVEIESVNARLSDDFEYGDDEDTAHDLLTDAVTVGLDAIDLADVLRASLGLPDREDMASSEYLSEREVEFNERRIAKRAADRAEEADLIE